MVACGRYIPGKRLELPEPNCLPAPSVTSGRSAMNTTRQPTSMPPLTFLLRRNARSRYGDRDTPLPLESHLTSLEKETKLCFLRCLLFKTYFHRIHTDLPCFQQPSVSLFRTCPTGACFPVAASAVLTASSYCPASRLLAAGIRYQHRSINSPFPVSCQAVATACLHAHRACGIHAIARRDRPLRRGHT